MVKKKRSAFDAVDDGNWTDSCDDDSQNPGVQKSVCQHVKKSIDTLRLRKQLKTTGLLLECVNCEQQPSDKADDNFAYDNTLWLCLKCGTQLCGRSKHQHALLHFQTPRSDSHCLTMNTRSFEIWCYECDNEVSPNTRKNLLECVELVKKLAQQPPALVSDAGINSVAATVEPTAIGDTVMNNIENKIIATLEALSPLVSAKTNETGNSINKQSVDTNDTTITPLPARQSAAAPGSVLRGRSALTNLTTANTNNHTSIIATTNTHSASTSNSTNNLKISSSNANNNNNNISNNSNSNAIFLVGGKDNLPRVRGLINIGNTCYFNAVIQCLAQTPYLLEILKELAEPGEEFVLPGGVFKFKDKEDLELPMIKGTLSSWGGLTAALAYTLEELQMGGPVFSPDRLFDKLCSKCNVFAGREQHDAHELLRQLLESVRSEDLKRYQRVILQSLGYKDQDINTVSEEMRQKCKIYGNQAADRILRPEQVFRGFLVSTLTCQECFNVSSRHEYFLDMSLPVTIEKPQPPQRRKINPEDDLNIKLEPLNIINTNFTGGDDHVAFTSPTFYMHPTTGLTKSQMKKEKEKERRAKRAAKHQRNKQTQKLGFKLNPSNVLMNTSGGRICGGENTFKEAAGTVNYTNTSEQNMLPKVDTNTLLKTASDSSIETRTETEIATAAVTPTREDTCSSSISTSEQEHSDADVEDNLAEDSSQSASTQFFTDSNGNKQQLNEKSDDLPENIDKDSLEEDENDSGIATSPAHANNVGLNGAASVSGNMLSIHKLNASEITIVNADQPDTDNSNATVTNSSSTSGLNTAATKKSSTNFSKSAEQLNGEFGLNLQFQKLKLHEQMPLELHQNTKRFKRQRTYSHSDWSTTIAPRYQCDDGECSIQSCLNNFTAVELMTGNNKVGCENCTKHANLNSSNTKMVNTNATKQFLISSPPAVLILHLKRFQLGPRCVFRKLTRNVNFPLLLDIAPFCGSKVKDLPNIDSKQKKLLYSLYGVVEHSGGMYGGHYTAYVKVRPKVTPEDKRWKFLPHGSKAELEQDDEQLKKLEELLAKERARDMLAKTVGHSDEANSVASESNAVRPIKRNEENAVDEDDNTDEAANVSIPVGRWYYCSDSRVQEVTEDTVLHSQAYLLFYERIY